MAIKYVSLLFIKCIYSCLSVCPSLYLSPTHLICNFFSFSVHGYFRISKLRHSCSHLKTGCNFSKLLRGFFKGKQKYLWHDVISWQFLSLDCHKDPLLMLFRKKAADDVTVGKHRCSVILLSYCEPAFRYLRIAIS